MSNFRGNKKFKLLLFSSVLSEDYDEQVAGTWEEFCPETPESEVEIYPEEFRVWFIDKKWKMIADLIDEEDEYGTGLVATYWFRDAVSREDLESLGVSLSKSQEGSLVLDDFDTFGVESNRFFMQSYLYRSLKMESLCAGELDSLDDFFDDLMETHCANYGIPKDWIEDVNIDG